MIDCAVLHDVNPGRLYPEYDYPHRSPFFRDGDRIIHTSAFRRLIGKTQVFIKPENDHVRNRLTHTIEVSRVSRQVATMLGLNPELAEAIALVHDLGHPPFGHLGENILNEILDDVGGFDHNVQTLRIVTLLENPYHEFKGLNLSWYCLEGIVKHNGPLFEKIPAYVQEYNAKHDLRLEQFPSCEAQVASLADDITYNCHDLQDGLRAGLFSLEEITRIPLVEKFRKEILEQEKTIVESLLNLQIIRRIFNFFVMDLTRVSEKTLQSTSLSSYEKVGSNHTSLISFSDKALEELENIRKFLWENMYQNDRILSEEGSPEKIISGVFNHYMSNPHELPDEWVQKVDAKVDNNKRIIGDYISGMTENFVIEQFSNRMI